MNDSTPIPEGALTVDNEPDVFGLYAVKMVNPDDPEDYEVIGDVTAAARARLLASQRPPGVPDDPTARVVAPNRQVLIDLADRLDALDREHADEQTIIVDLAAIVEWRDRIRMALGVPVLPYQPTPPEPEPADRWEQIVDAAHVDPAPVSEVRTGPLGLSEQQTREIATNIDLAIKRECKEVVARWDAEDAAPEPDTITVERGDLAAVLGDIDEWMHLVDPDAEMKDSVRRLRAAAGMVQTFGDNSFPSLLSPSYPAHAVIVSNFQEDA